MAARRGDVMSTLSRAMAGDLPSAARPLLSGPAPEPGIVHFGAGAFHRAHQAWFTERAMAADGDRSWGIVLVAPRSPGVVGALTDQDGLFTVLERDGLRRSARVVNAVSAALHAPSAGPAVVERLAAPTTGVVTLTITEKGYRRDPATGGLLIDEAVRADAAAVGAGRVPSTALGLLTAGLQSRAAGDGTPLTVISCDNLTGNGRQLAALIGEFVSLLPGTMAAETAAYLGEAVRFPPSMVDRIVPATAARDTAAVQELIGLRDDAAVVAEPFGQWVIEDDFAAARPAWHRAGVELVGDVAPYETAKLRLLNAAHSTIAYLGALAGHAGIAAALADPDIEAAVRGVQAEAAATVAPPPGWDLDAYGEAVLSRFRNEALGHRCDQVAADGSQKLPVRAIPTLRAARAHGRSPQWTALLIAAWVRFVVHGRDDDGRELTVHEPLAAALRAAAEGVGAAEVAGVVTRRAGVLTPESAADPVTAELVSQAYLDLDGHGVRATCRALVRRGS
ncbi:mannitol-1-phosphate/altronate dehydrogenase [Actinoalloteichus sp. GBA129-24]|nr:mannitol-1-phosphate/altronate dehydrogenase [Actinoalloteichus sp. GBA129-24]